MWCGRHMKNTCFKSGRKENPKSHCMRFWYRRGIASSETTIFDLQRNMNLKNGFWYPVQYWRCQNLSMQGSGIASVWWYMQFPIQPTRIEMSPWTPVKGGKKSSYWIRKLSCIFFPVQFRVLHSRHYSTKKEQGMKQGRKKRNKKLIDFDFTCLKGLQLLPATPTLLNLSRIYWSYNLI